LPQAKVYPEAAGTGTAISETTVQNYASEAGYSKVAVLEIENPFFRFYRLLPHNPGSKRSATGQELRVSARNDP